MPHALLPRRGKRARDRRGRAPIHRSARWHRHRGGAALPRRMRACPGSPPDAGLWLAALATMPVRSTLARSSGRRDALAPFLTSLLTLVMVAEGGSALIRICTLGIIADGALHRAVHAGRGAPPRAAWRGSARRRCSRRGRHGGSCSSRPSLLPTTRHRSSSTGCAPICGTFRVRRRRILPALALA